MQFFSKKQPTIAVHDGKFHADDIFACAALRLLLSGKAKIIRTRDQNIIEAAEYAVDVGGLNDPEKNRFDHHMPEGAGAHENGIPYAAFGLVWKKFGAQIAGSSDIAARIEQKLVSPIDADDNGVSLVASTNPVVPYGLHNFLYTYRPTWKENKNMYDASFLELVGIAEKIINREILIARDAIEAEQFVEAAYQRAADKRVIELDGSYPYQETLMAYPEPLFAVLPRRANTDWQVETIHKEGFGFENRKPLPASWAGLRGEELAKISGVSDALFCHRARFMCVAKTREGALALAQKALESK